MVFSSLVFILIFLPIFLVFYYSVNKKYKNYIILLFSLVFYAWGAPKFFFFLISSVVLNFYIVRTMHSRQSLFYKRLFLTLSLVLNVGLLVYFKYSNFFIENTNFLLDLIGIKTIFWNKVVLPIGISFFTFQSITYTVDVYRKVHAPLGKLHNLLLYIMMFPQMIAGPIIRFIDIADQIKNRDEKIEDYIIGFVRFVIGLAKKVLIADILAIEVDKIMAMDYASISSTTAWIGIVGFTFQIYFDFSGYSDMAIGLGKMMGFKLPENFNNPYIARSITEFWRRWHITFSTFMRNYLYYPLGGNRVKTQTRLYFNLWIVFLISGLWHGASWNFVIYGAFHGAFLVLDRLFMLKVLNKIGTVPSIIFTFIVIVLTRVFFRVETLGDAMVYFEKLFTFHFTTIQWETNLHFWFILLAAFIISFMPATRFGESVQLKIYKQDLTTSQYFIYSVIALVVLLYIIASLTGNGFSPFIYFRF